MISLAGLGEGEGDGESAGLGDSTGVGEVLGVGLAAAVDGLASGDGLFWLVAWVQLDSTSATTATSIAGTTPLIPGP